MKRWEPSPKPIGRRLIPASTGRGFTLTVPLSQPSRSKVARPTIRILLLREDRSFVYVSVSACRARGMGGGER